jgi:hypothetical protein
VGAGLCTCAAAILGVLPSVGAVRGIPLLADIPFSPVP